MPAIISGTTRYQPESASGTIGTITAMPTVLSAKPTRMIVAGRRSPALRPASIAAANIVSESGARVRPVSSALYSSEIWRKIGSAIIAPPRVMFCSACWEIPILKFGMPEQVRVEQGRLPFAVAPHQPPGQRPERERADRDRSARRTRPPPARPGSRGRRRPCRRPRGPRPTTSIWRAPVYGTSRTSLMLSSTTAITTSSRKKPTRHERKVVTKPPSSGPTAAAIAADAPTSAYAFFCAAPSKLPRISDCIAGSSSEAPRPPTIAQKTTIAPRPCASVIARAPIA